MLATPSITQSQLRSCVLLSSTSQHFSNNPVKAASMYKNLAQLI